MIILQRLWLILLAPVLMGAATGPRAWQSDNDYPTESLKAGEQGTVAFRLDIDAEGKASNCVVVLSSGYPRLDKATCDVMIRRARFTPATDATGVPGKGIFSSKVKWVIPGR